MYSMKKREKRQGSSHFKGKQKFKSITSREAPFTYVEAFKILRTNLEFASSTNNAKSILVTSALPDENKSTVAINLALSLAENRHSVILVECDLRMPTFCDYLQLDKNTKGLSDILTSGTALNECVIGLEDLGISVIHAGTLPPNPSELLNQGRMKEIIEVLKRHYDYVILDTPPVAVVTDAAVVGRMADGALLVVRSRFTPGRTIRMAKQHLEAVDVKVLGAVLTRYDGKTAGLRSAYHYKGYQNTYGQKRRWKKY